VAVAEGVGVDVLEAEALVEADGGLAARVGVELGPDRPALGGQAEGLGHQRFADTPAAGPRVDDDVLDEPELLGVA
jgi:hypothetical protein